MYHVDNRTAVAVKPQKKSIWQVTRQWFTDQVGKSPTVPEADWFNMVQDELLGVLDGAGIEPNKSDDNQLIIALKKLIYEEPKVIFGVVYPWFLPTPAEGCLFLNGDSFDRAKYPRLAAIYPTGILPNRTERYMIGASSNYPLGSEVQQQALLHSHGIAIADSIAHKHYVGIFGDGSHGHSGSTSASGDHAHTAWTDAQGNHQHTLPFHNGFHHVVPGTIPIHVAAGGSASATEWAGQHGHNIGVGAGGNHAHDLYINAGGFHGHATDVGWEGVHSHNAVISPYGSAKQLVDAFAINYMIKAE